MEKRKKTADHFFRNKYSRQDYFSIQNEFVKSSPSFLNELENQWNDLKEEEVTGFQQQIAWDRVLKRLRLHEAITGKTVNILTHLQRIAAILFLPLLISSLVYFFMLPSSNETAWTEIICPPGTRTEFELPDGSTGTLNGESSLKYATNFSQNRQVQLQGEAYFEVVRNRKRPFRVTTDRLKVEVLGTCFSVMAYEDQINEEVVLKTGNVKILNKKDNALALLSPDQQFVLNKSKNQFTKNKVNAQALTSWIEGKLVIENECFDKVAERLSRWYDVDIKIEDPNLNKYKYYGTFENEPLDEVLRLISITAPIKYKEVNRIRYKDGSFSQRKIILKTDENRLNDFN